MKNDSLIVLNNEALYRIFVVLGAIILPFIIATTIGLTSHSNFILLYVILSVGVAATAAFFRLAYANTLIPYLLLQLTMVWIFLDQKILNQIGLNLKPHALIFIFATIIAFWSIFKHFKYLWSNFIVFRFIFIFFIINTFYAFFYHTDFRNSTYIDNWMYNYYLKYSIMYGNFDIYRKFGNEETRFLIYLTGLFPLVSITLSLLVFKGIEIKEKIDFHIIKLLKYITFGFVLFYIFNILSILLESTQFHFIDGRLADGNRVYLGFEEACFLLFLGGIKFFLNSSSKTKLSPFLNTVINLLLITFSTFIFLGIKKGTIISLLLGLVFLLLSFFKIDPQFRKKFKEKLILFTTVPIFLLILLYFTGSNVFLEFINNIIERFSNTFTLNTRLLNLNLFSYYWVYELDFKKIIFGFGIDQSRELMFFISSMQPNPDFFQSHPHNLYVEFFYNYGLMALTYFGAIWYAFFKNFKNIYSKNINKEVKIFSSISSSIILLFSVYFLAESPAMPINILFFCLLGILESIKHAYNTNTNTTDNIQQAG